MLTYKCAVLKKESACACVSKYAYLFMSNAYLFILSMVKHIYIVIQLQKSYTTLNVNIAKKS